jgi:hypothetical protein
MRTCTQTLQAHGEVGRRDEVGSLEVITWLRKLCTELQPSSFRIPYFCSPTTPPILSSHAKCWLTISLSFFPGIPGVENCVEFQKTNGSLNVTSENATSPVIEFWE